MRLHVLGGLAALWLALAGAAPLPFAPPPPDLTGLVPFAQAPLDKPPVGSDVPLPPVPVELPPLPLAPVAPPAADRPVAFTLAPRVLACAAIWLGIPSESLECGRARFQRGEYEEAARALEQTARAAAERELLREARYWLGETYARQGRVEQADWLFRQVVQDQPRHEWSVWALHASGWTALRLGDAARAREAFTALLAGALPASIEPWARHGLGLASYMLGRFDEALQAWALLTTRGVPAALARDVFFWHGETLARAGQYTRAEAELRRFTEGGAHPQFTTGLLRFGWWSLAAGRTAEAIAAFRTYLATPAPAAVAAFSAERDWAEAGLALALLTAADWKAAREVVAELQARGSPLALPLLLRVARAVLDSPQTTDVEGVTQDLLALPLTPGARAWVLLLKGEADRERGGRDEARIQFDLARRVEPGSVIAWHATFRLARINFELRQFDQSLHELTPLLAAALPPELRAAALLLQGEAAYHAGDYAVAGAAFRRALVEFPDRPEAPAARLAAAWTSLRQGDNDEARRDFLDFARGAPDHPHAVDALVLAAELAMAGGDLPAAAALLGRIIDSYPTHPRTDFARLNRGILAMRTGAAAAAEAAITDWLGRATFPPLFGRAHAALGVAFLGAGKTAEAQREFALVRREGLNALASLGAGTVALSAGRWDDAAREFTAARDTGTPPIAAAAEYGLAAVDVHRGRLRDFKPRAVAALAAEPAASPRAAALLYVLTGIAVDERDWPAALGFARRLVSEAPAHAAADDALERVAAAAAAAAAWPVVHESDSLLRQHYPHSPFTAAAGVRFAQAQAETGRPDEARQTLEAVVAGAPGDPQAPQAWLPLARAREAAGDRPGALEAYARAARESRGPEWSRAALFGHARLLTQERRWDQARGVLERLLQSDDTAVVVEAAHSIGETYAGEGAHLAAAEYYLTAAYVAPASTFGRRGLLGAARSLAALKQDEAAAAAYRKLLAQAGVPAELADAARQGLGALGR